MIFVTSAHYIEDYRISVTFSDGVTKVVDLAPALLGPIFEPLHDPVLFRQFHVDSESDTIVWPNGADMSPEFLYTQGVTEDQTRQQASS